jgi:6-phosphofructokinase 2
MPDIVTITINPSVDIWTSVDRVAPTHKLRCGAERREPGGGGINVARVLKRLGGDVLAAYPSGGVIGQLLERMIEGEGVESLAIPIGGVTREDFTVLEEATTQEFRFVLPGPHLTESEWRNCLAAFTSISSRPRFVVASGSLPPGVPADFYAQIAAAAKRNAARVVVDGSGPALKAALDEGVYLVKPSLRELSDLVGEPLEDRQSWINASRRLVESERAEIVALTLGGQGALLVTKAGAWFADAVPVEAISAVGAGDSFLAAMIWALAMERPAHDAFRYGVAAGAAALLSAGTALCHREDIERFFAHVRLTAV